VLGRWASASFLLYLQVSDSVKKGISKDLGRLQQQDIAAAHQRVGDPAADVWLAWTFHAGSCGVLGFAVHTSFLSILVFEASDGGAEDTSASLCLV
jgi:hypothetical protein